MSMYGPVIVIKTKENERILYCEYSSVYGYKIYDVLENLVKQGLATLIKKSEGIYSLILNVPKATEPVMGLLIPEIERIYSHDVWMEVTQFHFERTADKEELGEEHEGWKKSLKEQEKKKTIELEALKSIPNDKGFII